MANVLGDKIRERRKKRGLTLNKMEMIAFP
jgi:urease gamma subunit